MMLLYGRRRIGKTYLLQRYFAAGVNGSGEGRPHCYFLAEQTTAAEQRAALAREILDALPAEGVAEAEIAVSWNSLLRFASQHASARPDGAGRFGLILDEFPYLVEQTPELPSIIQAWWDREGAHAPLFVVLCGSQLSAMAALGSESAPLFGRFNGGVFRLEALTYEDVAAFYSGSPRYGIPEVLTMYGVLGGTPRYHALADTSQPPESEIVTLLMQPRAILENEIRFLLSSEQIRDSAPYNAVLGAIAAGETQFGKILNRTGIERGSLSFYLKTLQGLGWVRRELPFGETSDRRALYRIADPFLSFWYRFVAPLSSSLQFSNPKDVFAERVAPLLGDYMAGGRRLRLSDINDQTALAPGVRYIGAERLGWRRRGGIPQALGALGDCDRGSGGRDLHIRPDCDEQERKRRHAAFRPSCRSGRAGELGNGQPRGRQRRRIDTAHLQRPAGQRHI